MYRVQPLGWASPAGHFPQLLGHFLANVLLMAESLQPCLKCAMAAPQASPMKPEFALSTHGTTWAQTRGGIVMAQVSSAPPAVRRAEAVGRPHGPNARLLLASTQCATALAALTSGPTFWPTTHEALRRSCRRQSRCLRRTQDLYSRQRARHTLGARGLDRDCQCWRGRSVAPQG